LNHAAKLAKKLERAKILNSISCIGKKATLIPQHPSNGLYIRLSSRLGVVATPNLTLNLPQSPVYRALEGC